VLFFFWIIEVIIGHFWKRENLKFCLTSLFVFQGGKKVIIC